jgi:hypothetical protein
MASQTPQSTAWVNSVRATVAMYQQSREVSEAFVRLTLRDGTDMYVQGIQGGPLDGWITIADYPLKAVEDVIVRKSDGRAVSNSVMYVPVEAIFKVEITSQGPRTEHTVGFRSEAE